MRHKQHRWNTFSRFSCAAYGCPGLATIEEPADDVEEPADDAGAVDSYFGGSAELLIFPDTL